MYNAVITIAAMLPVNVKHISISDAAVMVIFYHLILLPDDYQSFHKFVHNIPQLFGMEMGRASASIL